MCPLSIPRSSRWDWPVQVLDSDGKVVANSRIDFISPQVDNATQTVL